MYIAQRPHKLVLNSAFLSQLINTPGSTFDELGKCEGTVNLLNYGFGRLEVRRHRDKRGDVGAGQLRIPTR